MPLKSRGGLESYESCSNIDVCLKIEFFLTFLITSHTILVNDGNLNKMQMATKCFHLLLLLIMCFVLVVEGDKDEKNIQKML